jgi:hypothetical protein
MENLFLSTTPSRRRERRRASSLCTAQDTQLSALWEMIHGKQIAVETGNDEVIKNNEEAEIITAVLTVTTEKRKSLVRNQLK